ncbi:hypothetical protein AX16_004972 [Volvariella volvacea WC 439]|nr:hypothetical protein AX16_004972 [Volvariella volvacea WC 439]
MPRRSSTRPTQLIDAATDSPASTPLLPSPHHQHIATLRTNWKWAAFSQFFITFAPVIANPDITILDVENDLVQETSKVLPRIMQRLLYTLTYDRKISLDTWQNALRKQYSKRDPAANPIGPESAPPIDASPSPGAPGEGEEGDSDKEVLGDEDALVVAESVSDKEREVDMGFLSTRRDSDDAGEPSKEQGAQPSASQGLTKPPLVSESKDWNSLPMLAKLDSLHVLTEWQFQNVTRLRQIMKCDDEEACLWRVEPVGYDAKRNAYWHIGNQLWIQRVPLRPPKTLKRKRLTKSSGSPIKIKELPVKRLRLIEQRRRSVPSENNTSPAGRTQRAAKARANMKLDAQAKELEELTRQARQETRKFSQGLRKSGVNVVPPRPVGTRMSARLRGLQEDEEWQPVPEEWLKPLRSKKVSNTPKKPAKTGLETDVESISDLTELSEEDQAEDIEPLVADKVNACETHVEVPQPEFAEQVPEEATEDKENVTPPNFVEWEMQFKNATHYAEKALYKYLTTYAVPTIIEELREQERKRQQEEAITNRKRSSRLAIKEIQREEARAAARRRAEEEEQMSRTRRLEARQQEREAKESARELRRREREAREASRQASAPETTQSSSKAPTPEKEQPPKTSTRGNAIKSAPGVSRALAGDDWILDCEICHRRGVNLDDGLPMMSCGACAKWQHIACHDKEDLRAGHPKRNWDKVDFLCQQCRLMKDSGQYTARRDSHSPVVRSQPEFRGKEQFRMGDGSLPHEQSANGTNHYYYQHSTSQREATVPYSYPPHTQPSTISFSHYQPHHHAFRQSPTTTTPVYLYPTPPNPNNGAQISHQYQQANHYHRWDHSTQSSFNSLYNTSAARSSVNPSPEVGYATSSNQPHWQPQPQVHGQPSQERYPQVQYSYHRTV